MASPPPRLALAVGLARRLPKNQRVLLVDNDPQANTTMVMLDGRTPEEPTLADVLLDQADAIDAIRKTRVDRLDILPADGRLADCTVLLADELGRERRLRRGPPIRRGRVRRLRGRTLRPSSRC